MLMYTTEQAIQECKRILQAHYGARLKGVVLYGSVARGDADAESDIDLLVLLDPPFAFFEELRRIVSLVFSLQQESPRFISALPILAGEYDAGKVDLYRIAKREGVAI